MSPPEQPPRRKTLPSITEVTIPGAIHSARPPVAPPNDPRPPPKHLRGSSSGLRMPPVAAPLQPGSGDRSERTLTGIGIVSPSEPPDSIRDSREITTDSLLQEAAERGAKLRAAEAANAAKDAEIERLKRSQRTEAPPASTDKFDAVAYFTRFQVIALKILLPIAAVAAAVGVTLGIYSKATIEPKVDRTATKQEAQATKTTTVEDRVLTLEKYVSALAKHSDCVDAERDSAIERGTGHRVDGEHSDVQWAEGSMPVAKPRTLWKNPPWFIAKDEACPSRPAPPRVAP